MDPNTLQIHTGAASKKSLNSSLVTRATLGISLVYVIHSVKDKLDDFLRHVVFAQSVLGGILIRIRGSVRVWCGVIDIFAVLI